LNYETIITAGDRLKNIFAGKAGWVHVAEMLHGAAVKLCKTAESVGFQCDKMQHETRALCATAAD
jgi:hypothetical protein